MKKSKNAVSLLEIKDSYIFNRYVISIENNLKWYFQYEKYKKYLKIHNISKQIIYNDYKKKDNWKIN